MKLPFGLEISRRKSIEHPETSLKDGAEWLFDSLGGNTAASGVRVNEQTAMRSSAVSGCLRVLSSSIGSLPLVIYEKTSNGRKVARKHHLYPLLHDAPNRSMSSMTWRQTQQIHLTASGNAYAFIKRGQKNKRPQEIIPLMPNAVEPERKNGELVYTVTLDDGSTQQVEAWRMIHVPGMGFDGVKGYSPIKMASENIGLALAAQEFGGRFFGQGANVNSVIEMPGNLKSPEEIARFKKSFSESYQGLSNAHGTPLLEDGAKLVRVGVPPEEAQFLETRKFQVEDIARIYGVPLHMLSSTEKSTSWGTGLEQQNLGFLVHTLRPWLVAWEQELNRKLLLPSEREKYNIEFKLDALLRGDTKSRYEGYSIGRQWGWLSVNDIRELENMDRIDGGDAYLVPLNMQPHDEPAEDNEQVRSLQAAIVSQIVKREYNGLKSKVGSDDLAEWWAGFSASTREGLKTLGLSEKRATQFINSGLDVQDIEGWQERRTAQLIELLRAEP